MNKKYYVNYDLDSGEYLGFYPTDVYPDTSAIPEPKIELSESEWMEARNGGRYRVINGTHTESPPSVEESNEEAKESIKRQRLRLLKSSDWVVLPHSPVAGAELEQWITYRQALRDVTDQEPPYSLPDKPNS